MALKLELLDKLKRLHHPSQFDEVLIRLDIDFSYISGREAAPATRAIDLLGYLEQTEGGLGRLQRLLEELDWFKEFLPEGTYPIGRELREREEARERQAMEEATARGEDPENYRVTPEKFYTFRPEAAWLGVFRGWDASRSFHSELIKWVVSTHEGRNRYPAAAIIGPGGSGKSVALRRLAVDLAKQGYKVWWVEEDPEQFLLFGLTQLAHIRDAPQFLLLDNIQNLDNKYAQRFQQKLQKNQSLILVVAGRSLPRAFRARVSPGAGLFVPDEAADRVSILEKIVETIPAWAETARQLAAEPLREARLIRILVVLARQKAIPRNVQELETAFLEILADDISRIHSTLPGLAEAVIDAAAVREVGHPISRRTLIVLADYHQPGASIPTLLEEINGNRRWQALAPLLSYDPKYHIVQFHHDELAEGLVLAGQHGLLGLRVTGDDPWRQATLDVVISRGSRFSSSYALSGFVRNRPGLISKERALGYIRQLLATGNGHHAYLRLIVDEALALEQQERLDLLLAAAEIVPFNRWLWDTVWGWIQRHHQGKKQRGNVLEQLYQAGCRAYSILTPLLQCLPPKKAQSLAREWLADPATQPQVLCSCLDLLGVEAKDEAKRLLADPTTNPFVLCSCLDLLGAEAKDEAKRLLADPATNSFVLCSCLDLLGAEAKDEAKRLLADPATNSFVLCSCLDLLGAEAKDQAKTLLADPATPSNVLCSCLDLLGAEAKDEAKRLLADPATHPDVLCRCLDLVGEEAKDQAKTLLADPATNPSVLRSCLDLLGTEAKDQAKTLLADPATPSNVLCSCLDLLGAEAKDKAKTLLADPDTHHAVLCSCLNLLGEEAREEAKRLLADKTTHISVLCRCLDLLGEEAKDEARTLLVDSKEKEVLCRCLDLLGEEAKDEAKRLLADSKDKEVLCRCLDLLGEEAKDEARTLLANSKDKEVLCGCLGLLGVEAKDEAKKLLVHSKDKEVLCRCLDLLGEEAKPFAVERIRCWTKTDPALLARCFQVAGATPEAQKAAEEMLTAWDEHVPAMLRVTALRAPFDTPLRIQRALEVLDDWRRQYRPLVAAALATFWNAPDAVIEYCRAIISRWHKEIFYRHKHRLPEYDGYIVKALSHPALRKEARKAVQDMLSVEARSPGFLSPELRQQTENIMQGQWPPWSSSEEETS